MKKIYWRPRAVSRPALVLIALLSLSSLIVVERWPVRTEQDYLEEKRAAAELAQEAFDVIKKARQDVGPPIDPLVDPAESGLIGLPTSPVTSKEGDVSAKQTSANPNFAAVIVDMLKEAEVKEGDVVAIGISGSFPALNICTYAACETLKVTPLVISSASASQWGANVPALMWPDMEMKLRQNDIFNIKSIACSIGGEQDRGQDLSEDGLKLVVASIERCGLDMLEAKSTPVTATGADARAAVEQARAADFVANIDARMRLYEVNAKGKPIKAYINVGGGMVSVGKNIGKLMFKPGLNDRPPTHVYEIDGVMPRFSKQGVPVIHMVHINTIADRYQLPLEPTATPSIGSGGVFYGIDYSKPLVIGVLAFILLCLYGFIRSDVGFRMLRTSQSTRKRDAQPEPMV
ncbi:MAG: poly-gamma-glutamate system protein [Planctomycetota bacterium]|nr:MAG: poly-gamma-glutamate system protein [Planctomycetota bacterium]